MKILYGVQATGNGHISRSREVIRNLKNMGQDVQVYLVVGKLPCSGKSKRLSPMTHFGVSLSLAKEGKSEKSEQHFI